MADVTIFSEACGTNSFNHATHSQVFVTQDTGYQFYVGDGDFSYKKTTDGGATWGTAVDIETDAVAGFSVWFDKWTPGGSGKIIHITLVTQVDWVVRYYSLDTSNDSLSCSVQVAVLNNCNSGTLTPSWATKGIDITKARGGNLYVAALGDNDVTADFDVVFSRSTDGGSSWSDRSDVYEGDGDRLVLQPGDETDSNDIWAMYFDDSAQAVSLKVYDDSANSWSETAIASNIDAGISNQSLQIDAAPRHSDNHSIFVVWDVNGGCPEEFKAWDIGGSGDITALTDPVVGSAFDTGIAILIDQNTNDLYVVFGQGSACNFDSQDTFYVKSDDGGTTWGCPVQVNEGCPVDQHDFFTGVSIPSGGGGRLLVVWGDNDNGDLLTNKVNSVILGPTAVVPKTSIAARLMELDLI